MQSFFDNRMVTVGLKTGVWWDGSKVWSLYLGVAGRVWKVALIYIRIERGSRVAPNEFF